VAIPETLVLCADEAGIAEAARRVLGGEPVAVPTETVYGLAADATNAAAVAAIYTAKGRPSFNPLIGHVADLEAAEAIGEFDEQARALADGHWPGPLTLVVPARPGSGIAPRVMAGLSTIAIRVPAHPVMQALLAAVGRPLAAPSANASGRISPTSAAHVLTTLGGRIGMILDGGITSKGVESTIVDATSWTILRPGPITAEMLEQVIRGEAPPSAQVRAPGMLPSHYAPTKPVRLDAVSALPDEWLIGFGRVAGHASLSAAGDLAEAAANLFARLHEADVQAGRAIAVAPIPNHGLGLAINDRLRRAAADRQPDGNA
jgi:L-threonylcarbamoyladenylate synthase